MRKTITCRRCKEPYPRNHYTSRPTPWGLQYRPICKHCLARKSWTQATFLAAINHYLNLKSQTQPLTK